MSLVMGGTLLNWQGHRVRDDAACRGGDTRTQVAHTPPAGRGFRFQFYSMSATFLPRQEDYQNSYQKCGFGCFCGVCQNYGAPSPVTTRWKEQVR